MTNKVEECIGFHYLLTKIQLSTLILLKLNIFHMMHYTKSKKNPSHNIFRTQSDDFIMRRFYCIALT